MKYTPGSIVNTCPTPMREVLRRKGLSPLGFISAHPTSWHWSPSECPSPCG